MTEHNTGSALGAARAACPKHMRHGPCGGVRPGGVCEADAKLACPYLSLYDKLPWRQSSRVTPRPRGAGAKGALADRLRAGGFASVVEVYPPDGADPGALLAQYKTLLPRIDAINVPDNPLATPHLSALAMAALAQRSGIPAILNVTCRDRNRIALQSDLLAASALGVENIFCITGDHPALGDHHDARPVFDLDSFELLALARQMRDEGVFGNGQKLDAPPTYLIGAVSNPFIPPAEWRAERTAAKVAAGADFIQMHPVPDMQALRSYLGQMSDWGVFESAWLIAGVVIVTSLEQARWLQTEMPTPLVADDLMGLLYHTPPEHCRAEALAYTADLIADLRHTPGVSGVLLFPMGQDFESVAELVELADLGAPENGVGASSVQSV
jgi:methylenetetrahydrofolate reductase (NADPH)